jgi:hypothetical protein
MALKLKICASDSCNGITVYDTTGPYSPENLTGYGVENGVESPEDFDSYIMSLWKDGQDPLVDPPLAIIDMTNYAFVADDEGNYPLFISLSQLGVEFVESGVWYIQLEATLGLDTYLAVDSPIFLYELTDKLEKKMPGFDPTKPCKNGCEDVSKLASALDAVSCYGSCSGVKSSRIIKWIRTQLKNCC